MTTNQVSTPRRHSSLTIAILTAFAVTASAAAAPPARPLAGSIPLRTGAVQTAVKTPAQVEAALATVAQAPDRHFVIQFNEPVSDQTRARLAAAGVTLHAYLGNFAYFAARAANLQVAAVVQTGTVRDILPVQAEWKLHPALLQGTPPSWSIVDVKAVAAPEKRPDAEGESDQESTQPAAAQPQAGAELQVAAYVMYHPDVPLNPDGVQLALRHGALIRSVVRSANMLVVEMPLANIQNLAGEDAVQWIEPPIPAFQENNGENRVRTGADIVQAAPYNLDGQGVTVLVYDGGYIRTTHLDFQNRAVNGAGEPACETVSDHSTHVAGTIGGAGIANPAHKGMAPAVNIVSYAFNTGNPPDCSLTAGFLYTDPGDIESNYTWAIVNYGAHIANNSIGTNTAPNGFDCSWEGNYGATDVVIDNIVRGTPGVTNGQPFRVVWANGNERQGTARCGSTYRTTAPPACAKNHITVGALNSNDDSVTSFTSWGPADDGRMKPDISAPGCQVGGDAGVTSCASSSDTGYTSKCGTSMASPTVCGLGALLLQDYRVQFPGRPDFRNSTLKILLAHTAVDLFNPGPDNQTGYGSVRIQPAVDFMRTGNFLEAEVGQSGSYNVLVVVAPGDPVFKATLAWDDVPGTPNVNPVLVNDLDLVVFDPNNVRRYPWTLDLNNPGAPAVQTQENHVDNIEQVFVASPTPGVWRVEVRGFNVPQGPQPFSLCASPLLVNCSSAGVMLLNRGTYKCQTQADLRVVDCDLNTNDNLVETVTVTIASSTEPGGESVLLTETGPQTADFRGSINLSTTNAAGVLQVAHGDTLTATYIDADDGQGGFNIPRTANANVDCVPPVISNVAVSNIGPRTATITFNTSEPCSAVVRYGTACGALNSDVSRTSLQTAHSFTLTGLADDTQHFFAIEVTDIADNQTIDDNGGSCYTFTTTEIPDPYTEEFLGDFDLQNTSLLWSPNGSIDVYALCTAPAFTFPTDPAGGTNLTLADNGTATITLGGGQQVSLYGVNYGTFHIGANGYITFNTADTDSTPTFADHFNRPRISALFANLNPALGGTVSWKQLADRVAVTFENVPIASTTNSNSFQYELFFDGRIRLTFLTVQATSGITGLSAGGGIPADFAESNLSSFPSCGPQPPSAASRTVETPINSPITIALIAGDDGQPGPLSYIITSLPTLTTLKDTGNNYVITAGDLPYTLSGGGNQVTYETGGTVGVDSFQFKANDGGTSPTGGDSNIATVTVNVQPVLTLPFFEPFPATSFDTNKWAFVRTATIDTVGLSEPSEPYSARFNGDPSGSDEIRTHLFNLASVPAVRLSYFYQQRGGGESPDANDDLFIEYQDSGGNWQLLQQHLGADPDMTTYAQVSMLLPAPALHSAFRLRIRNTATAGAFDDWFVDDIRLVEANAPTANNANVTIPFNTPTNITLVASDPTNDPLSYIIESLPTNGALADVGNGNSPINTVPYTLVGGGNVVRYTPNLNYGGPDAFTFKANDGTYDSNTATVSILVEPVLALPFVDQFPTTTFDPAKWQTVTNATIDDVGINEPSAPYSARFNGNPTANGDSIISYPINLAGQTSVRLTYWYQIRGGGDSPEAGDDLFIEYRDSGGNWQLLQQHLGSGPDMTTYEQVTMMLPPAAMHAGFRLRIRSNGTAGAFDDWFVDDIGIVEANAPTATSTVETVSENTVLSAGLPATDPQNDPLTYRIETLPTNGLLKDPNGAVIGSAPYVLSGGGSVVLYKPAFNYAGTDQFTWTANDGTYTSNVAQVAITIGGPQPVLTFPLNSNPGWTTEGEWAFGQPTGGGTGNRDPTGGYTGTNVYGYNLNGNYPNSMPATLWLTTTALDLTGVTGVQLRFRRWLGIESSTFDKAFIEVSNNGTTWANVWTHSGATISEAAWSLQTYSISATADNQSTVYIRWGLGPTDASVTYPGWNIDDVEIWGLVPSTCGPTVPGDLNGDSLVNGDDIQGMASAMIDPFLLTPAQTCAADVNQDNAINSLDIPAMVTKLLSP